MLGNNTNKIVELFVESLLWGKISLNYNRLLENGGNPEYVDNIYKMIKDWNQLHHQQTFSEGEDIDYMIISDNLYDVYIQGRVNGFIQGELIDETYEFKIKKLEKEIEDLKVQNNMLLSEKSTLYKDNILLANELMDRRQQITAYEGQFYKDHEE